MKLWEKFLRSERFLGALAGLVVSVGVIAWGWSDPEATEVAGKVVTAVMVFVGLFIGAKTLRKSVEEKKDDAGGSA